MIVHFDSGSILPKRLFSGSPKKVSADDRFLKALYDNDLATIETMIHDGSFKVREHSKEIVAQATLSNRTDLFRLVIQYPELIDLGAMNNRLLLSSVFNNEITSDGLKILLKSKDVDPNVKECEVMMDALRFRDKSFINVLYDHVDMDMLMNRLRRDGVDTPKMQENIQYLMMKRKLN